MIVKIIPGPANRNFGAVNYNTNKIDKSKGELMTVSGFGPLQSLGTLRPQDYINYLQMISTLNKNISRPQFNAVISGRNKSYDKLALTKIAEDWLREMGYGAQPYLIIYHKDTDHNHVHMVSTRINKDGKKISSAWENVRAQAAINKVLGYELAFQYRFSTRAQFFMILESCGYSGIDPNEKQLADMISEHIPDKNRVAEIRGIFQSVKSSPDFRKTLIEAYQIELIFHATDGQKPYGYSVIDHGDKQVFKGSEVMPLKELLGFNTGYSAKKPSITTAPESTYVAPIQSIWIADDIDDQQILGKKRRRQKKARTNTR